MVRYADDIVVGFERETDARRFWDEMRERLREFSLSLPKGVGFTDPLLGTLKSNLAF